METLEAGNIPWLSAFFIVEGPWFRGYRTITHLYRKNDSPFGRGKYGGVQFNRFFTDGRGYRFNCVNRFSNLFIRKKIRAAFGGSPIVIFANSYNTVLFPRTPSQFVPYRHGLRRSVHVQLLPENRVLAYLGESSYQAAPNCPRQ
jgi:hypothetical protein